MTEEFEPLYYIDDDGIELSARAQVMIFHKNLPEYGGSWDSLITWLEKNGNERQRAEIPEMRSLQDLEREIGEPLPDLIAEEEKEED